MWRTWREMMLLAFRRRPSFTSGRRSSWAALVIGASGLRSSCASIARNSSLSQEKHGRFPDFFQHQTAQLGELIGRKGRNGVRSGHLCAPVE
jgi:hypothetical protein